MTPNTYNDRLMIAVAIALGTLDRSLRRDSDQCFRVEIQRRDLASRFSVEVQR